VARRRVGRVRLASHRPPDGRPLRQRHRLRRRQQAGGTLERGEDQTARLVADALDTGEDGQGGSSLVFVNSRRNAESSARKLTDVTGPRLTDDERDQLRELADEIRSGSDTDTASDLADAVEQGLPSTTRGSGARTAPASRTRSATA